MKTRSRLPTELDRSPLQIRRPRLLKAALVLGLAMLLVLPSCASSSGQEGAATGQDAVDDADRHQVSIFATIIRAELGTKGFDEVFISTQLCPDAIPSPTPCAERIQQAEQEALLVDLRDIPGITFVDDPSLYIDIEGGIGHAVVIGLGPVAERGAGEVRVPAFTYCGNVCGFHSVVVLVPGDEPDSWDIVPTGVGGSA